jgi:hypothetical protein
MKNPFTFEPEPFASYSKPTGEFEAAFEEISSDEKAQASADAARRAARRTYDQYKTDCKGVRLLRRLTRESSDSTTKSARLRKRVEQVPEIFRKIRLEDEKLKVDLKSARSERQRESLRKQQRINVAKLLDQAGFDPRVNWTEESALAHARCELSEFNWIQYSFCSGEEVANPGRFAKSVAEHYVRTETGLSLDGQTAQCKFGSVFCDVRFANGIVIRVNFSNIPDYFTAIQIAPRAGPKREYRYSCFRGQINLSPNQDTPPAGEWPHGSRFSPQAPSIPSGPFGLSRPTCEDLQSDVTELQSINESFSRSVELLDKLVKQKPRNEPLLKETAERAKRQQATLRIVLVKMINRTRSGGYLKGGCSHKDIAKVACKISQLPGVWLRNPPIKPIKELRNQLVSWLMRSRGAFARVPCHRL